MNFVVISAALSSMNTNVYLCSRMLFSLSRGGYAPQLLGTLSRNGAPLAAILVSGVCILVAAGVSIFTPNAYYVPARRGAVRRHAGVDVHPAQPPELPAPSHGE